MDSGIKAAAWSPDDEQLVMVTGKLFRVPDWSDTELT